MTTAGTPTTTGDLSELPDMMAPELIADPYRGYGRLREQAPVLRASFMGVAPTWMVTRYEDVHAVLGDPRFARGRQRNLNRAALLPMIEEIFRGNTVAYWHERLIEGGIICSPVYDLSQTFADPQVQSRGMKISMEKESIGRLDGLRNPIRYSRTQLEKYVFPPRVGEHTDEVLSSLLNLSEAQIVSLRKAGAV